ncbi:MAG TPA: ferrochelatase [Methylomirabilota bacterium]|jgi:ferrochelatase|nr:ferrochelatase [Methylomirabilota bacterium]
MTELDSVMLIAFGGPEKPEDIRPFLRTVTEGRRISPERVDEVARHYEAIGGRSPLNELTRRQAAGLEQLLIDEGRSTAVYVGMRNWHPFLRETLAAMKAAGHRRALGIILSPFQTEASWGRYVSDVAAAREKIGQDAPEVLYTPSWSDHPLYVETMADRAAAALTRLPPGARAAAHLVFTAHSVPVAMAQASPYTAELETAAGRISSRLGHPRWSVAYQSRSGSPGEPWLEPDIADAIRSLAKEGVKDVVVVPIGFVCDHVEVLYDLDVEAREVAEQQGLGFHRAPAANDHPRFIAMLADLVRRGPADR